MREFYCERCDTYYRYGEDCGCSHKTACDIKKFWMVADYDGTHERGGNSSVGTGPRVRHESLEVAKQEAKRLAKSMTGKKFIVLGAVEIVYVPTPEPVSEKL